MLMGAKACSRSHRWRRKRDRFHWTRRPCKRHRNHTKHYTEIFSATESANLPLGLKEKQAGFESAVAQMSSLTSLLAGFEQDIRHIRATTRVAVSAATGTVAPGTTTVESGAAVLVDAGLLDQSKQAEEAAAGSQAVAQAAQPKVAPAGPGGRPLSPDRAGGAATAT